MEVLHHLFGILIITPLNLCVDVYNLVKVALGFVCPSYFLIFSLNITYGIDISFIFEKD